VAAGRPEDIVKVPESYTGRYLKDLLERRPQGRAEAAE
jgi:excinuclease ABC subunit A